MPPWLLPFILLPIIWGPGRLRPVRPVVHACRRAVAAPGTGPTHPYYPVKSGCEPTWMSFRT